MGVELPTAPPEALGDGELIFSYPTVNAEQVERAKQRFEQEIRRAEGLVRNSTMIVEQYNGKLAGDARSALERRRTRVLEAASIEFRSTEQIPASSRRYMWRSRVRSEVAVASRRCASNGRASGLYRGWPIGSQLSTGEGAGTRYDRARNARTPRP